MRYIGTISVLILVLALWFFCVYSPISYVLTAKQNQINAVCSAVTDMQCAQKQCDMLSIACAKLEKNQFLEYATKPTDERYQVYLSALLDRMCSLGIALVSYSVDSPRKKDIHTSYCVHIVLKSSLSQIVRLFKELESLHMPVVCARLSCNKSNALIFTISADFNVIILHS